MVILIDLIRIIIPVTPLIVYIIWNIKRNKK